MGNSFCVSSLKAFPFVVTWLCFPTLCWLLPHSLDAYPCTKSSICFGKRIPKMQARKNLTFDWSHLGTARECRVPVLAGAEALSPAVPAGRHVGRSGAGGGTEPAAQELSWGSCVTARDMARLHCPSLPLNHCPARPWLRRHVETVCVSLSCPIPVPASVLSLSLSMYLSCPCPCPIPVPVAVPVHILSLSCPLTVPIPVPAPVLSMSYPCPVLSYPYTVPVPSPLPARGQRQEPQAERAGPAPQQRQLPKTSLAHTWDVSQATGFVKARGSIITFTFKNYSTKKYSFLVCLLSFILLLPTSIPRGYPLNPLPLLFFRDTLHITLTKNTFCISAISRGESLCSCPWPGAAAVVSISC